MPEKQKITITEALSEVNLVKKKIAAKQEKIRGALVRADHVKDPFEKEDGSVEMIKREFQAIQDLSTRLQKIRAGISQTNISTTITIEGQTRSIHDWLVWRRELQKGEQGFIQICHSTVKQHVDSLMRQPQVVKDNEGKATLVEYKINVDYAELLKRDHTITEILERLDGQLSLKNATITFEI